MEVSCEWAQPLHFSQSEGPHICCLSGALTPPFLRRYVASCVRTVCTSVIHVVMVLLLCPLTPSFFLSASAVSSLVLVSALPCLSSRLLPGCDSPLTPRAARSSDWRSCECSTAAPLLVTASSPLLPPHPSGLPAVLRRRHASRFMLPPFILSILGAPTRLDLWLFLSSVFGEVHSFCLASCSPLEMESTRSRCLCARVPPF